MTKDRLIEYLDSADFNSVKTLLLQLQSHEIEVTALAEVLTDVLHKPQAPRVNLSDSERRLLSFVMNKPRSKSEIIDHLYGTEISIIYTENRFHNLLSRLRKKIPQVIVFENEKYHAAAQLLKRDGVTGLRAS